MKWFNFSQLSFMELVWNLVGSALPQAIAALTWRQGCISEHKNTHKRLQLHCTYVNNISARIRLCSRIHSFYCLRYMRWIITSTEAFAFFGWQAHMSRVSSREFELHAARHYRQKERKVASTSFFFIDATILSRHRDETTREIIKAFHIRRCGDRCQPPVHCLNRGALLYDQHACADLLPPPPFFFCFDAHLPSREYL